MQTGHWLKLRLRSRVANGAAVGFGDGTTVIAHVDGVGLRRSVSSTSYLSQSSRILHFGLGSASVVQDLEVRWLGGETNHFANVEANAAWEITEGEPSPRRLLSGRTTIAAALTSDPAATASRLTATPTAPLDDRTRVAEFWKVQRAAMNAMKVEKDIPKAIGLFRAALELNPNHEDSHYYLGNCLAMQGDADGALAELKQLIAINPQSHRGYAQLGTLRAIFAKSETDLAEAEQALETAHRLNPEETGALLGLGEVSLLRGNAVKADERLGNACRTNPKAVSGFFLRGYLAWKRGDLAAAEELLHKTREALGKDWQPKGTTDEGDVQQKWHIGRTTLSRFSDGWDGNTDPAKAFAALDSFLIGQHSTATAK
jgi:tetratricopeptide (TPR) repeat protein